MAYTDIDDPSAYFQTALHTGNGGTQSITNDGNSDLQPDWVWIKGRSTNSHHALFDSVRTATKRISSSEANAETTESTGLTSFNSDGWSTGSWSGSNSNNQTYVSWQWKAGGTASSNSDGSITTTVSVNQTAGFSIIKYAGNSQNSTIGHGLNAEPEYIIFKEIDGGESWRVWSKYTPNTSSNALALNLNNGAFSQTGWISAVSSSTISIGTDSSINTNGNNYIAYAFAPKKGFSRYGSYQGNGSNDGAYIHLGFKASFFMLKNTASGTNWFMLDNKRDTFNVVDNFLSADQDSVDQTTDLLDITSNGIKQRNNYANLNASGNTYIYMAFAENPFVTSTGIPTTAR
jgi:hypothetical protein